MDTDLALILGLVISGFSIPSIISAMSDGRSPRVSMITILLAGGLILYALMTHPGGYSINQIPDVFFGVIGRFLN
ncbi:MAG: hypothetical protein L3J36_05715 [Rhodobacteraceae bacterium]|nr:hypothetical protein [Paracoccaceae bacterium]